MLHSRTTCGSADIALEEAPGVGWPRGVRAHTKSGGALVVSSSHPYGQRGIVIYSSVAADTYADKRPFYEHDGYYANYEAAGRAPTRTEASRAVCDS